MFTSRIILRLVVLAKDRSHVAGTANHLMMVSDSYHRTQEFASHS